MATEAEKASGPADVGGLEIGAAQTGADDDSHIHPGLMTPTKEAPGALFTHMVLPIAGFATRGVLWYQRESDDEVDGAQWRHEEALRTVIADWRAAWQRPDLPFLVVQLPGFGDWMGMGPHDYPTIRACQQKVADTRGDELVIMLEGDQPGPLEVRFAQTNWFRANLYNGAEIPALPFAITC